ncbi:hypothetical protein CSA37_07145 [Candidatus Fermentibacteria bacterium]|nr:MAG: hypothetical protein CSA37_10040 [Candidatus Fermentibacteria bacterium]PIE52333.1 MAG: hypothetical protein CSA37_07145 [Candidatus Fermentibacteria bacterium]
MSSRIDRLLDAEKQAASAVEEAERKARGIRNSIPEQVSAVEDDYRAELENYEKKNLAKLQSELDELGRQLAEKLETEKTALNEKAGILEPRALELIRRAVEGESG